MTSSRVLTGVHAIPRLSPSVLAERRAAERVDAHDGSWRVYVTSFLVTAAMVVAFGSFCALAVPPLRAVYEVMQPYDVVGAAATLAAIIASVLALIFHNRATTKSSLASACVVYAWLALVVATPMLLICVLVGRFGLSA